MRVIYASTLLWGVALPIIYKAVTLEDRPLYGLPPVTKGVPEVSFSEALGPSLNQMIADAEGQGFSISITSGYRPPETQADIIARNMHKFGFTAADREQWEADVEEFGAVGAGNRWADRFTSATRTVGGEGERGTPMRNWIALPGMSNHQTGNAADLAYGSPEARDWAHENASTYGLHFRLGNEPWHIEPINMSGHSPNSAPHDHTPSVDVAQISDETNQEHANRAGSVETTQNQAASAQMTEATEEEDDPDLIAGRDKFVDKVVTGTAARAMDSRFSNQLSALAEDFVRTMTPEQRMIEGAQYAKAKRYNGESADFTDWFANNRFDGYLTAFTMRDASTLGQLSQQQQQLLANAKQMTDEAPTYAESVMGLS